LYWQMLSSQSFGGDVMLVLENGGESGQDAV
jgi:hypothetical protein